jgi:predicted phosphohydrolase
MLELDVDTSPRADFPPPATSLTLFDGDDSLDDGTVNTMSFMTSPAPGEGEVTNEGNLTWDENQDETSNDFADVLSKYNDVVVVKGNYDAWITIHEVKNLKPFNPDNSIDPVVFVECMGQRFNTRVVTGVNSYKYDKTFMAKKEVRASEER